MYLKTGSSIKQFRSMSYTMPGIIKYASPSQSFKPTKKARGMGISATRARDNQTPTSKVFKTLGKQGTFLGAGACSTYRSPAGKTTCERKGAQSCDPPEALHIAHAFASWFTSTWWVHNCLDLADPASRGANSKARTNRPEKACVMPAHVTTRQTTQKTDRK